MDLLLVHNPTAGDAHWNREALLDLIRRHGHTVEYVSAEDRWQGALQRRPDFIVAAGGDGTIRSVACAVIDTSLSIAPLPLGTANNVAATLGLSAFSIEELVAGWSTASLQPFDVGLARGPWGTVPFLESVGAGLLAEGMAEIAHGSAAYVDELHGADTRVDAAIDLFQRLLERLQAMPFTVSIDGRDVSGDYVLLEALNFGAAGPNLSLAPTADPHDGLLDLVLVDDRRRQDLVDRLRDRQALSTSDLPRCQGRRITLGCNGCRLHLDDELWRADTTVAGEGDIELSILSQRLVFLVPS